LVSAHRKRNVSPALKAYAAFTTSAARGTARDVDQATSPCPS
jgi:dihydroxy-acid dehydratase